MRLLPGIRLSKRQREQVDEIVKQAVEDAIAKVTERKESAIGFHYTPVSDFEE
jgi:hypothetical protein